MTIFNWNADEDAVSMLVLCNERPDLIPIALFDCDTRRGTPVITFISFPSELDNEFAWDPHSDFCLYINNETTKTTPFVPPYGYEAEREIIFEQRHLEVAYRYWKSNGQREVKIYQFSPEVFEYVPYNLDKLAMITANYMKQCGIINEQMIRCEKMEFFEFAKLTV